ncbi:MAG: hypothetical protein AW10_02981 [Candidatus Accumulibacter appositus]|uniref:Uncharacterized protein n=1 Tax=Candidatus Accumulibacter appositus TaxID=1454003 RepID=A0A011QIG1_9PROT|nr:MAG: hypothetical protein AW10_02981 [Candidatus Accumulibacter appositus]
MNRLSDKLPDIGNSWAIASGRYTGVAPIKQRLVLLQRASWAIDAYGMQEERA